MSKSLKCTPWKKCVCLPGSLEHCRQCGNAICNRGLGHIVSARPLEGLETEVNYMGSQPYLNDGVPIKMVDIKVQLSFSAWEYSVCITTHLIGSSEQTYESTGGRQLAVSCLEFFWTPPIFLFPWLTLISTFLALVNHNCEYNRFQWVLWLHLANYQNWG